MSKLLALVLLAAIGCLVSCGPAHRQDGPPWGYEIKDVPSCSTPGTDLRSLSPDLSPTAATTTASCGWQVTMSPETFADLHKRELVLDAVDKWKADFEQYWSMSTPQTRIVVFDQPFRLADGSSNRWGFWPGLEHPEYQDVVLIWAGNYDLPWLFHELCHRVLHVVHDMNVDEPWWAQWNAADTAFDATLASRP